MRERTQSSHEPDRSSPVPAAKTSSPAPSWCVAACARRAWSSTSVRASKPCGPARAEELAYADYLSGRGKRAAGPDALSRLVSAGVLLKSGGGTPALMEEAVEIASAQGWRRPLLAWLGVLEKRAREAGDHEAAARVRRRINLISG